MSAPPYFNFPRPSLLKPAHVFDKKQAPSSATTALHLPIIAICHLSWYWVWQRPQQFLSRLAKTHPLLFVETSCSDIEEAFHELDHPEGHPNISVMRVHLPACHWHDGNFIDRERRRVVQEFLRTPPGRPFAGAILWINDPMAVTANAGYLGESLIVYDCMDELSQFAGAPPTLVERELELVRRADVIFCGGQKMRRKRLPMNSNTHFYGTGVDCVHFGDALNEETPLHPEIKKLRGPVLGYFGVIDERIDYELLEKLADANPDWSIAMVGPFAKVNPEAIPKRPNLHWLGPKSYQELPSLTRGMDVCMMPFALNAATEYINPTKALEYMAAGKPVVSTALDEVKSNFSSAALIAKSHEAFISLCRKQAASPSRSRIRRGLRLAADNTWECIVAKMNGHIADVVKAKKTLARPQHEVRVAAIPETPPSYV